MSHNWTCHYVNLTCLLMSLYNIICYITEYDVTTILYHVAVFIIIAITIITGVFAFYVYTVLCCRPTLSLTC